MPWHTIIGALEATAAVLYIMDLLGVFHYGRRKLPRFRAASDISRARLFSAGRTLALAGLMLTLALGFVAPLAAKATIAAVLAVVVVGKQVLDWRQDVASLKLEALGEESGTKIESPLLDDPEASIGDDATEAEEEDAPPPHPARAVVKADRVELSVSSGSAFQRTGAVTCEVTDPNGTTYGARVFSQVPKSQFGALVAFAPQVAVVEYPMGFPRAPAILKAGTYSVRWEVPDSLGLSIFGSRVIHDSFVVAR
jgi:hypothetical protein